MEGQLTKSWRNCFQSESFFLLFVQPHHLDLIRLKETRHKHLECVKENCEDEENEKIAESYLSFLETFSGEFERSLTSCDVYSLYFGLFIGISSSLPFLLFLNSTPSSLIQTLLCKSFWIFHFFLSLFLFSAHFLSCLLINSSSLCVTTNHSKVIYSIVSSSLWISLFFHKFETVSIKNTLMQIGTFETASILLSMISFFSSSLVEEEHILTHFLCFTFFFLMIVREWCSSNSSAHKMIVTRNCLGIVVCGRVLRGWNSSGDKWSSAFDTADWLSENKLFSEFAFVVTLFSLVFLFVRKNRKNIFSLLLFGVSIFLIFLFKLELSNMDLNLVAQIAYLSIFVGLISYSLNGKVSALPLVTLWLLLIHRQQNSMAILLMFLQIELYLKLSKLTKLTILPSIIHMDMMGKAAFFSLGNSNSLATIDFNSSYTATRGLSPSFLALSTFFCLYSAPILFFVGFLEYLSFSIQSLKKQGTSQNLVMEATSFSTFLRLLSLTFFSFTVIMMREHLFIWTVFSPKYLYEISASVFLLLKILILIIFSIFNY